MDTHRQGQQEGDIRERQNTRGLFSLCCCCFHIRILCVCECVPYSSRSLMSRCNCLSTAQRSTLIETDRPERIESKAFFKPLFFLFILSLHCTALHTISFVMAFKLNIIYCLCVCVCVCVFVIYCLYRGEITKPSRRKLFGFWVIEKFCLPPPLPPPLACHRLSHHHHRCTATADRVF